MKEIVSTNEYFIYSSLAFDVLGVLTGASIAGRRNLDQPLPLSIFKKSRRVPSGESPIAANVGKLCLIYISKQCQFRPFTSFIEQTTQAIYLPRPLKAVVQ